MRVLLLHPEDDLPSFDGRYDLIVDFGRAPYSTYERWRKEAGCPVQSLFDFAAGFDDVYRVRDLLQLGMGYVTDEWGVDWWDVLSLMIEPDLLKSLMIARLAHQLKHCVLHLSRNDAWLSALCWLTGSEPKVLRKSRFVHRVRHYRESFRQLSRPQIAQVIEDKFDGRHQLRRHFAQRKRSSGKPVVLLPSAYINVSRTAAGYASLLPDQQFLLVYSRSSGKLRNLPANVDMASLDQYCRPAGTGDLASLVSHWGGLRSQLVSQRREFQIADAAGIFSRMPSLLRWGLTLRNGWNQVFKSENVIACLSADDTNPHTRLPLILAKHRGISTVACHHGALDYRMAVKANHADTYLAKDAMEQDYLLRRCLVHREKLAVGSARASEKSNAEDASVEPCLTYFTEPYQSDGWRVHEVYRDLLPRLWSLSQSCRLKLVLKIHPFESEKAHRRFLRQYLCDRMSEVALVTGPTPLGLWNRTRIALTVESSIALNCASRGIPVFFCAWLASPCSTYIDQFLKFGVGHILHSPGDLAESQNFLETKKNTKQYVRQAIEPKVLRDLLCSKDSLPMAVNA
jgi:hypothetical protein